MFRLKEQSGRYVELEVAGKLSKHDYQMLVPQLERIIETEGKLRALVELEHFHGWESGAILEELRFDVAHRKDFDRVAVVGDHKWQDWAIRLTAPFFSGTMRFFDHRRRDEAEAWVREAA
jgi:hypothetical protein